MTADLLEVGTHVRATYPNASWGEGRIIDADPDTKVTNPDTGRLIRRKPYVVERDGDGALGYFHVDQIEPTEETS